MVTPAESGIVSVRASGSVDQLSDKLRDALKVRGIKLFALIDHSQEAADAGLEMSPTKLFIFGTPEAGTPIMLASPTSAIDLPLKILVWQDDLGHAWISYNDSDYLQRRHAVPQELMRRVKIVQVLVEQLIGASCHDRPNHFTKESLRFNPQLAKRRQQTKTAP